MNYKGAVFFDSDGTLTDDTVNITMPTDTTIQSLKALEKNGYLTVLCTGRAASYAGHVSGFFKGAITSNGAYAVIDDNVIYENYLSDSLSQRVLKFMDENGVLYCLDNPEMCYCSNLKSNLVQDWLKKFSLPVSAFSEDIKYKHYKIYKISVMFEKKEILEKMRREFEGELSVDMQQGVLYGDVSPCGFGKGGGVKAVIEKLNIPFENTYAFGDSENDVSMLSAVSHGVAMGRHAKSLEKCAQFITKTVSEEGVSFGLKHFGLI